MVGRNAAVLAPRMNQLVPSVKMASGDATDESKASTGFDAGLLVYFALWYLGNYYYNITNKLALKAAGGAAGFPMSLSCLQLGVGVVYATFLWAAPDARPAPKVTAGDLLKMIPVGVCAAGSHAGSVFALGAGSVSFAQIVKSAEPAFAAVIGTLFYGSSISLAKWLALIPVIGGVVLASVKELDFAWSALISAAIANAFAAFKGQENKKLMSAAGIKDRIGGVGNQFALTTIIAFLVSIPVAIVQEGSRFPQLIEVLKTNKIVRLNLLLSGLWFYGYNELATMTLKKTNAVTQSVANTAKRVIVIVGVAIVMGESLDPIKLLGCSIGIGGVFLYSIIDNIVKPKKKV
jgi:solute carrier family 35 protein E1